MAKYNLLLDTNLTSLYYAKGVVNFAVGDKNGTRINVTLGDGFDIKDLSKVKEIEFRATAPDGVSIIQSSAAVIDKPATQGKFHLDLPTNISQKSGDINDARFRIIWESKQTGPDGEEKIVEVVETTSIFRLRVISTPGMLEVNGDIIDRIDKTLNLGDDMVNALERLKDDADVKLKTMLTTAQNTITAKLDALETQLTTKLDEWQIKIDKVADDGTEAYKTAIEEINKSAKKAIDDVIANGKTKVQDIQDAFDAYKITMNQDISGLKRDVPALSQQVTEAQRHTQELIDAVANIDINAIKNAANAATNTANSAKEAVDNLKTTVDGKAEAEDVYTKTEMDEKLKDAGKVQNATINGGALIVPKNGTLNLIVPDPDLSNLITKTQLDTAISAIPQPDLSKYATSEDAKKAETNAKNYTDSVLDGIGKDVNLTLSEYDTLKVKDPGVKYWVWSDWKVMGS